VDALNFGDWRFVHAGLIVRDCRRATAFYCHLGFDVVSEPYVTPPKYPDNAMSSCVSFVARGGILLEIMEPLDGRWVIKDFVDKHGEGVNHLCFEVDDIQREKQRLEAMGFPVIYGFDVSLGKFRYFDTRKIGNIVIELLEPGGPGTFTERLASMKK
jgi:methylmalonyl-CoA/ethylmalonyl-CoA epimerase